MKTRLSNKFKKSFIVQLTLLLNLLIGLNANAQINCSCPGNLVLNPSFENGTTNWNWSGGNFSSGNGAVVCGSFSGDFQITNTTNNYVSQTIGTDLVAGTILNATVYAGVHDNTFNSYVRIAFFDASWNYLSSSVSVEVNKILANSPIGPQFYTLTATVPVGAKYTQAGFGANGNWIKTDNWCITAIAGSGSIGDRVWLDANGNGLQDAGETGGITGVSVQLKNSAGTVIATTTTNSTGNYLFSGLGAANYTVVFPTNISGTVVTPQNVGTNDAIDSDASPTTGATPTIALAAGQNITHVDAGYCPTTLELGNRIWYDTNNNGINEGENGIFNAIVNLYKDDNNDNVADGASIATTNTDANGYFRFSNLGPGNYIVGVITPTGYVSSAVNGGDPDNNINLDDNGQVTVGNETRGLAITLIAGTEPNGSNTNTNYNDTYDFGFLPDCACTTSSNNLLVNGNFENGTNGWSWNGGTLTTGTGYIACGVSNGFNNWSAGTSRVFQEVNITAGSTVTFSAFAGTHTPGLACSPTLSLIYLNSAGAIISQLNATVTRDVNVNFNQLAQYTLSGVAPNGTTKVRVQSSITCNTMKMDAFCLTSTPPPCPVVPTVTNASTCEGTGVTLTATGVNGATFKWYATATSTVVLASTNTYATGNLSTTTSYFVTQTSNGCESPRSQVTVTVNLKPVITDCEANINNLGWNVIPTCIVTVLEGSSLLLSVNPNGFVGTQTWAGPNGYTATGNDAVISSSITTIQAGVYTITMTTPEGCSSTKSITVVIQQRVNLGNTVWYDTNNNGTRDAGETGISAATVNLYLDANNDNVADGVAVATTTTNASGVYNFANLAPGNYIVGVTIPTGYAVVATNGGDPDNNTDNDNNGTNTSVAGEIRSTAITLAAGTEPTTDGDGANGNLTLDFGLRGTGSIGNFVWNDVNANGVQDLGEVGINGANVILSYPNGQTVTTTTSTTGAYNFPNLAPGTYGVSFTTPTGFLPSPSNVSGTGVTDANDSDPITGVVSGIVLSAGQDNNTVDAGFYLCSVASGINGPITICAAEQTLFTAIGAGVGTTYNWTFDQGTPATATGTSVNPSWSTPGEYLITLVVTKNGCTSTYTRTIVITQSVFAGAGPDKDICSGSTTTLNGTGPTGANYSWTVISGDPTSIDNGANQNNVLVSPLVTTVYQLTVTQNGCTRTDQISVFINVNKNPIADAGPNKVTLVGTPIAIGGSPTGTPPFATPGAALGYIWSAATGLNDATLSNPTATLTAPGSYTYQVIVYSILTGCSDTSLMTLTVVQPVNIGNTVWYDKNNNGIKNAGEQGVATTVNLYKDDNNDNVADGAAIATTTTNPTTGAYNFGNLYPGNYIVGANIPNGYAVVTINGGDADNDIDNDNNGTNTSVVGEVRSSAVTLTAGGEPAATVDGDNTDGNLTLDFGFKGTGSIGNFVWNDLNRNGLQDPGEPGIPNATVNLSDPDGVTTILITDLNGAYSFKGLIPGSYNVSFATPAGGYLVSPSNVGSDDAIDSDPVSGTVSNIVLAAGETNNTIDAGFIKLVSLSGNVWHDVNGMNDNLVNNSGATATPPAALIPTGLRMNRVEANTGLVKDVALVLGNGTFNFPNVLPGNYILVLSTTSGVPGQLPPFATLPNGWINTGEKLTLATGRDPVINGKLSVNVATTNVTNANFGIQISNGDGGIN